MVLGTQLPPIMNIALPEQTLGIRRAISWQHCFLLCAECEMDTKDNWPPQARTMDVTTTSIALYQLHITRNKRRTSIQLKLPNREAAITVATMRPVQCADW